MRLIDTAQAWDLLPRIYSRIVQSRPGTIDRPEVWWGGLRLRHRIHASGASYVAIHGEPGSESGLCPLSSYRHREMVRERSAHYRRRGFLRTPRWRLISGLLRFLLGLDLIDRVVFWMLPVDDPLPWLLVDRRAAKVTASARRNVAPYHRRGEGIVGAPIRGRRHGQRSRSMMNSCRRIRPPSPSRATALNRRPAAQM